MPPASSGSAGNSDKTFYRYRMFWDSQLSPADVIVQCIRKGGEWQENGRPVGAPLFTLYRDFQHFLWPDEDDHEWGDLILKTILENRVTVVQASKDASKTHSMAKYALCDYFAFPRETLILMSSTDLRGLELRVWGDIKELFNTAKERWPNAPGYPIDHKYGIFTDGEIEENQARSIKRGLIAIPVMDSEGQWTGLRRWVGVKQKRRRVLADEAQFYPNAWLPTISNLNKGNFKLVAVGNPIGENDPLDKLAEPKLGWDSLGEITKTTTWENRMGGVTIQLYGPDSPAIKNPGKFTYLIDQSDIDYIISFWGKDSAEYWNQAIGVRKPGVSEKRVLTRDLIQKFHANEPVVWGPKTGTKVYGLDASYGGDRCMGTIIEFGVDINGVLVLAVREPTLIPVQLFQKHIPERDRKSPEDQIAEFVRAQCQKEEIPPSHVFHDATGRGSLGTAFARLWSADTNPVEFGGKPTARPVQSDLLILDADTHQRRLKRCDEHYVNFVSELWFSIRYIVEAGQMRGLPNSTGDELCGREWGRGRGNRIELEIKEDTKRRLGRSPDAADSLAVAVEGARRLGFTISKLETRKQLQENDLWKDRLRQRVQRMKQNFLLDYQR